MNDHGLAKPNSVSGLRRLVYIPLGLLCVGLAILGVVLPILPTTPFLLLASYFFVRSSPRLNAWLLRSRIFGGFLRDWQRHRAVKARVKIVAVLVLVAGVTSSAIFANLPPWLLATLLVLGLIGLTVVLRLPVLPPEERSIPVVLQPSESKRISS